MKKIVLGLGGLAIVIAILVGVFGERLMLDRRAGAIERRDLTELQALLAPAMKFYEPDGADGPLPTLIMFHGCAGYRTAFMETWAKTANDAGFLAVGVDSHTPRGIDYAASLETVCTGQTLIGMERVGDIRAAIDLIAKDPRVDGSRIVIAGWSHGAWTLMDHFAMAAMDRAPPALADDPDATAIDGTIIGEILFYPYCGIGAMSRLKKWNEAPPAIAFVAGRDSIVDGPQCKRLFDDLIGHGAPIDLHYYPDADHVFDDPTQPPEYAYFHDPDREIEARARVTDFLRARVAD